MFCSKFCNKLCFGCYKYYKTCYWPGCEFRGCCGFPHGMCYTLMGQMMALGGMTMCMYVVMSCFFQQITQINPNTGEPIENSERGYGFISREADFGLTPDYRQCMYYPSDEVDLVIDGWLKSGRFFAFLSSLLGLICLVVLMFACCFAFTPVTFERWLMWFYIFGSIFMGLTFLIFGSNFCQENECKLGQGGGYGISGFLFFLCAANSVKSMAPALPKDFGSPENDRQGRDLWYDDEQDMYRPRRRGADEQQQQQQFDGDDEYEYEEEYESGSEEYESGEEYDSDEYETDDEDDENNNTNVKTVKDEQARRGGRRPENVPATTTTDANNTDNIGEQQQQQMPNFGSDVGNDTRQQQHPLQEPSFDGDNSNGNLGRGYEDAGIQQGPRVGDKDGPTIA